MVAFFRGKQFHCLAVCLLAVTLAAAQPLPKTYSTLLTVTTENDRYMFQGKDRYYTNGINFALTKIRKKQVSGAGKQTNRFELGQKIFMPYSRKIYVPAQIDRPVTGYLFARFTRSNYKTPNFLWQWGVSADAIGDASLGRSVQNTFHQLINVNSSWWGWVWDYQLKSQVGVNLHGLYARGLLATGEGSRFQVVPVTRATLGTSFTNLSQGVLFQFGQLRSLSQSDYWEAVVESPSGPAPKKSEWFFYYHPEVTLQVYNATVQGGLFRKDKGPITSDPEPLVVLHQAGFQFSRDRYLLRAAANFQGREDKSQKFSHNFGTLTAGFRFR